MSYGTDNPAPDSVEVGKFLPQPPGVVWHAITDPPMLERWLMKPVGFDAAVGTGFVFAVPTAPTGEIACEVLKSGRDQRLTYSWVDLRAKHPARWILDWALYPQGCGTRIILKHSGFDTNDRKQMMARNALERGWRTALTRLDETLDQTASRG